MPRTYRYGWLLLCLTHFAAAAEPDRPTLRWMQTVLVRWEQTCRRHLNLPPEPLPWIVFYDDRHAWHVNPESKMLPERRRLSASLRFAGRRYPLFELETTSGLWLPDGEVLPVKAEGVTKPYAQHQKVYAQMALPALWWKEHGQDSIPVEHLYSEALHELTHTRQMTSAMQQITVLQARYHFRNGLDDDIIERTFGGNDEYRKLYEQEKAQLMQAVMAPDLESCRRAVAIMLETVTKRQQRFFRGEHDGWAAIEGVFLALEGSAVWVQAQMALDHAPAGQDWKQTLTSLAPFNALWSQEEGGGLFFVIDRLVPDWQARYFGSEMPSPFAVLRAAVGKPDSENPRVK
jgi:hypothetical protein